LVVLGAALFYGPAIRDLWSNGVLPSMIANAWNRMLGRDEARKYSGDSAQNLHSLYTAMSLYQESEEMFPDSSGWMDALEDRVKAGDMSQAEADKKFHDPTLGTDPNVYGYAMNDLLSRKYIGDVTDPAKTPLLFDSSDTKRNAHGTLDKLLPKPARPGGNLGVAADGHALKL
jgi:hypothetical protein